MHRAIPLLLALALAAACGDEAANPDPDPGAGDGAEAAEESADEAGERTPEPEPTIETDETTPDGEAGETEPEPGQEGDVDDSGGEAHAETATEAAEPDAEFADDAEATPESEDAPESDDITPADADTEPAPEAEGEDADAEEEYRIPACRPGDRPLDLRRVRGELQLGDVATRVAEDQLYDGCDVHAWRLAAARGMRLKATLTPVGADRFPPLLQAFDARAISSWPAPGVPPLAAENSAPGFPAEIEFAVEQTGEHLLLVAAADLASAGQYALELECLEACEQEATRYPIILLHGSGGFADLLGGLDYFFQVEDTLRGLGYDVHTLEVASFHSSEERGAMLAPQVDAVLEATHAAKVNIIGHSQGGVDTRFLISSLGYGDRVGVAVLYATPNRGSLVADVILGYIPGFAMEVIAELVDVLGMVLGTGSEQDTMAAAEGLSMRHMETVFNPANPDDPRVSYWSWTGETCSIVELDCINSHAGEIVEPALSASFVILWGDAEGQGPNDGMVTVESATWGEFQGIIFGDHMDEVGHLADLANPSFDHLEFFTDVARQMFAEGF